LARPKRSAHLLTMLPSTADVQTPPEKKGGQKQPEVDFVNALKRFLVRSDVVAVRNAALPAPRDLGYQSKLGRPNHKLVLRNDPCPYNYPSLINIFHPL
jgi:hypothetical protein